MTEGVVGGAFVELRPRTDGFQAEAEAKLIPASRQLGLRVGAAMSQGVAPGARAARSEIQQTEQSLLKAGSAADLFGRHLSTAHGLVGGLIGFEVARKAAQGIKTAIDYADDLQVTLARNSRTFGDNADQVDRFGERAARSFGLSRNEADTLANSFGTLATRLGVSQDKAASMSITLTKLAADLAASKGGSAQQAADAIQTALTGRGVALRRYGIILDSASLKEEAYKLKLIDSTKSALSPATKALASYQLIVQGAGTSTGFFAAHQQLTNEKLQIAHKEALNASESLGVALRPAMNAVANLTANDLNPALEGAGKALEALSKYAAARDIVVGFGAIVVGSYGLYRALKLIEDVKKLSIFNRGAEVAARTATTTAITAEGRAAAVAAAEVEALNVAEGGGKGGALSRAERAGAAGTRFGTAVGAGVVGLARGSVITAAALGIYGIGTEGLLRGDEQKKLREGAIARGRSVSMFSSFDARSFAEDLGHRLGSKTLDRWSGYTADKAAADAAMRAAAQADAAARAAGHYAAPGGIVLTAGRQAAFNLAGVTAANKQMADKVLAAARAQFADPKYRDAQASALDGALGGAFDELPKTVVGNVPAAQAALAAANARVASLEARLGSGGRGPGSAASIASAEASVLSARDAIARRGGDPQVEALRLQSAEARLASLRTGTAASTARLRGQEDALTAARAKAKAAADKLQTAEGSTALSATDLLKRLTGNVGHAVQLRDASKKLVHEGITGPVLEDLDKLEKTAPGTLVRVAATATPALIKAMNAQKAALDKVESEFTNAPTIAVLKGLKAADDALTRNATAAGKKAGQAYAAGVVDGLGPVAPLFLPGGISGGVKQPAAPSSSTPGGYTPLQPATPTRPAHGDPRGDGAPHTHQTHYHLNGPVIASDPAELHRQLVHKARLVALS